MLLDSSGKPIKKTLATRAIVFSSVDGEDWEPLEPDNVPDWVKSRDVMGDMIDGAVVAAADAGPYYCAESVH
jgi:hypothetical protein